MITPRTYHIEFLTPCQCRGAYKTAEVRASSVRGQLRWWFRCLGGNREQETTIFGGLTPDTSKNGPIASLIRVQITNPPPVENRCIPAGSKAEIKISFNNFRSLPAELMELLELTFEAFFSIGALGAGVTRGYGAITSQECALDDRSWNSLKSKLEEKGFKISAKRIAPKQEGAKLHHAQILQEILAERRQLREKLKKYRLEQTVGSATPRQASVLHFRPIRIDNEIHLAIIEAPHERVLGDKLKQTLESYFAKKAPGVNSILDLISAESSK